jgi:hypothetical protein
MNYSLPHPFRKQRNLPTLKDAGRFPNQYLGCYHRLSGMQMGLLETEAVFSEQQVWPDQCEEALDLIAELRDASKTLTDLLADAPDLHEKIRHRRYSLLLSAGYLNAQCHKAISFLGTIPDLKVNSKRSRDAYGEVRYLLRSIRSSLEELLEEMQVEKANPLLTSMRAQ